MRLGFRGGRGGRPVDDPLDPTAAHLNGRRASRVLSRTIQQRAGMHDTHLIGGTGLLTCCRDFRAVCQQFKAQLLQNASSNQE